MSSNAGIWMAAPAPHHSWGWFLLRGIVAILFGILALVFPLGALIVFAAFFAAFALIDGIAALTIGMRGLRYRRERTWGLIVSGIVGIAVGVIYLVWPIVSTISYALVTLAVLSLWAIFTGLLELWTAFLLRGNVGGNWLFAISGLLSVLLGLAIPIITGFAPGASILTVGWLIGIYALAAGISLTALALRLKRKGS